MAIYLYDGEFDSLISLCAELIGRNEEPDDIAIVGNEMQGLFDQVIYPATDKTLYESMRNFIDRGPSEIMRYICGAFLSEIDGSEMAMFRFIQAVKSRGYSWAENMADDRVREIIMIQQKVFIEKHRMLGLLRFSELNDGTLYARYEPDHNITAIVAPHFSRRLAKNDWIIHDIRRSIGALYKKSVRRWDLFDLEENSPVRYSDSELEYRRRWQLYCREISIPERKNPRCQKHFMPVRYWKHLVEKQAPVRKVLASS